MLWSGGSAVAPPVHDEWEVLDFIGCKEVAVFVGAPTSIAGHTTPRAVSGRAAHSKPHQTPKSKSKQQQQLLQQREAARIAEEEAPFSPASMARQVERELSAERSAAKPLDAKCRAHALLGKIVWAPPADDDGWEKVRVEAFHKRREHPYDVVYLWSENPAHSFGERDAWESRDFDTCRDIGDFDDVASPGGGRSGKQASATARKRSGGKSTKRAREAGAAAASAARPAQRKRVSASASAAKAALPRAPQTNLRTPAAVAKRKRGGPSSGAASSALQRSGARGRTTGPRPKKSRTSTSSSSAAAAGRGARNLSVKGSGKVAKKSGGASLQGGQGRPLFQESSTLSANSSVKDITDVVTGVFGINHLGGSLPSRHRELGRINLFMRTNLESERSSASSANALTFSKGALFVAGPPGTGKTATVDFALKHMAKVGGLGSGGYATIRLNCMMFSSAKLMVEHIVAAYTLQSDAGFSSAALSARAVSKKATALRKEWRGSDATPIERMRATFSGKAAKVRRPRAVACAPRVVRARASRGASRPEYTLTRCSPFLPHSFLVLRTYVRTYNQTLLVLDEVDRFSSFMSSVFELGNDSRSSLALIGITNDVDPHRVLRGLRDDCASSVLSVVPLRICWGEQVKLAEGFARNLSHPPLFPSHSKPLLFLSCSDARDTRVRAVRQMRNSGDHREPVARSCPRHGGALDR